MKTLRIFRKTNPNTLSNTELVQAFLKKSTETPSVKELRERKSVIRKLRKRFKEDYLKGLLRFKNDTSNLLDIIELGYDVNSSRKSRKYLIRFIKSFLFQYNNDAFTLLTYKYTKYYIYYKDLTQEVVDKMVNWALTKARPGFSLSTVMLCIAHIKASIRHAFHLNLIDSEVPLRVTSTPKVINRDEPDIILKKLSNFKSEKTNPWYQTAADFFMISYLANGMRILDIVTLKWEDWYDGTIIYHEKMRKNASPMIVIMANEKLSKLIMKYANKDKTPSGYIFPFINPDLKGDDLLRATKHFMISINRYLKKIGKELNTGDLTIYQARHIFFHTKTLKMLQSDF